jgi:hypothetical protein
VKNLEGKRRDLEGRNKLRASVSLAAARHLSRRMSSHLRGVMRGLSRSGSEGQGRPA